MSVYSSAADGQRKCLASFPHLVECSASASALQCASFRPGMCVLMNSIDFQQMR